MNERSLTGPKGARSERTVGCSGCLGTTLLLMLVSGALIWALNPGMSVEDAARGGILVGGGVTAVGVAALCAIPLGIIALAAMILLFGRRRVTIRSSTPPDDGTRQIIDVD
jgi:hypothetical protein